MLTVAPATSPLSGTLRAAAGRVPGTAGDGVPASVAPTLTAGMSLVLMCWIRYLLLNLGRRISSRPLVASAAYACRAGWWGRQACCGHPGRRSGGLRRGRLDPVLPVNHGGGHGSAPLQGRAAGASPAQVPPASAIRCQRGCSQDGGAGAGGVARRLGRRSLAACAGACSQRLAAPAPLWHAPDRRVRCLQGGALGCCARARPEPCRGGVAPQAAWSPPHFRTSGSCVQAAADRPPICAGRAGFPTALRARDLVRQGPPPAASA